MDKEEDYLINHIKFIEDRIERLQELLAKRYGIVKNKQEGNIPYAFARQYLPEERRLNEDSLMKQVRSLEEDLKTFTLQYLEREE